MGMKPSVKCLFNLGCVSSRHPLSDLMLALQLGA